MSTEEKLINIIINTKKVHRCYLFDEFLDVDYLISKINILLDKSIIDNIGYLKNINTEIFTDKKYFNEAFMNNQYRKYIEENIDNVSLKKINFSYDLIKKYIGEDYEIFKYLTPATENQILKLGTINPNILLFIDNINENLLINLLKNNYLTALTLDGDILEFDDIFCFFNEEYKKSYLYLHRKDYLNNPKIYNLYIEGIKKYLASDIINYIHLSKFAKNSVELARYVLDINPKLLVYTGNNIKNNEEIMLRMLEIDPSNTYYLSEPLKEKLKPQINNKCDILKKIKDGENNMNDIKVLKINDNNILNDALEIRKKVFTDEKSVPRNIEHDKYDESLDLCDHFIIIYNDIKVGTLRCLNVGDNTVQLQRFCFLKDYRNLGLGKKTLTFIEDFYKNQGINSIIMDAKYQVSGFYEKCGYIKRSEIFVEAGIEHVKMSKNL